MKKKTKSMFSAVAAGLMAAAMFGSTALATANTADVNTIAVLEGNGGLYIKGQQTDYEIVIDLPKSEFASQYKDIRINAGGSSNEFTIIDNEELKLDDTSVEQIVDERTEAEAKAAEEARKIAEEEARKIAESQQAPATTSEAPASTTKAPASTTAAPVSTTEAPPATSEAPAASEPPTTSEAPAATAEAPAATAEAPAASGSAYNMSRMGASALQAAAAFFAPVEVCAEEDKADITISSAYLDTLADGVYTIALRFTSGQAVAVVTVASDASAVAETEGTGTVTDASPATGDNTNMIFYVALAACSAGVLIFLGKKKRAEA